MQLNPNHAVVLSEYASWASGFGEPEKGAEAAERFVRLNPNYPMWASGSIGLAFFLAGRYEDSLRALARKPEEARTKSNYIVEAASLAGLGRVDEARAVVARALARFPDISVEGHISRPDFIEHERRRFAETMHAAGFPVCAKLEELAKFEKPIRLPECEAKRANAVSRS